MLHRKLGPLSTDGPLADAVRANDRKDDTHEGSDRCAVGRAVHARQTEANAHSDERKTIDPGHADERKKRDVQMQCITERGPGKPSEEMCARPIDDHPKRRAQDKRG